MKRLTQIIFCIAISFAASGAQAKNAHCNEFDARWFRHEQLNATDLYAIAKHAECISKHVYVGADPSVIRRGVRRQDFIDAFDSNIARLVRNLKPYASPGARAMDAVALAVTYLDARRAENNVQKLPYIYFELMYSLAQIKLAAVAKFGGSAHVRADAQRSHEALKTLKGQAELASQHIVQDDYPNITWFRGLGVTRQHTSLGLNATLNGYGQWLYTGWYECRPKLGFGAADCDGPVVEGVTWHDVRGHSRIEDAVGGFADDSNFGRKNIQRLRRLVRDKMRSLQQSVADRINTHTLTDELSNYLLRLYWISRAG